MSRVGKKPISVPDKVKVEIRQQVIVVEGPLGKLEFEFRPEVGVACEDNLITVSPAVQTRFSNALHGLTRALVQNMVVGVTQGYEKKLEIFGTGYLAAVQGQVLQLRVGFANEIHCKIPSGVDVKCPDQQHVVIKGIDKQKVTQFAAEVRAVRKAEPYLGKGIKYEGEAIRRKVGKAATKK
ncbi:MAG: 50S ribosomal protein L6 [Planctomycetaceae bacterium]|jgi:large subunit ribosomal protein L6|nr:50S ribosomal protein L6 [Planctomycetaceae bacterium]